MKQKTYRIKNQEEFYKWIDMTKNDEDYKNSHEVVFKIMTAQFFEHDVKRMHTELKKNFPKAKIIGASFTNFTLSKEMENAESAAWVKKMMSWLESYSMISCCYFDTSEVTLIEFDSNSIDNFTAISLELNRRLKKIPYLKGVEIFAAKFKEYLSVFMDSVSVGLEDVPFFGAEAGAIEVSNLDCKYHSTIESVAVNGVVSYIMGEDYHTSGVIAAAYSGKDLHVKAEYNFGWKPIGKEMTITETLGINGVSKIDGIPATEIYRKYLNVEPNKFLVMNVFDFPFVVDRGGIYASRVAGVYDDAGRLYMSGDVRKGEKVRLSYGNPDEILRETWESSERIRKFDPQGIFAYVCGARTVFLNMDAETEIQDFRRIVPDTMYCFGGGEIFKHHGQGGQMATAFIVAALREGEPRVDVENSPNLEEQRKRNLTEPLTKRLAFFLDAITGELNESKEKFREAALAAEAAGKAKTQFLSNMSHEIRTPINAILGMNEMILRESKDKQISEYAENIRNAGNTLLGIVNDILDFSKIEAGKMEIIPVEYALSSVLNDLVNMIRQRAEKKGLYFKIEADKNLPSELFGDEIRIKQAVTNILTNAVKYTEHGGVSLKVSGEKISEDKILISFSVKDTGIGIKEDDLKKLFSAFERIEEKRNRSIEGTGLGMNITQRILHMMGSELRVQSVYGEGSEFSFTIEQKIMNDHPLGNFEESYRHALEQHKKYKEKFTAPEAKILVVDDTLMNLTVVKGLLKQTKIQIDTATGGYECLSMVTKNHYDIIFLDHRMPGIDGIETLQRMKNLPGNLNSETPVISLTANAISGARQQYINAGFTDYLTKPIDSAKLENLILDLLPPEKISHNDGTEEKISDEEKNPEEILPDWLKKVDSINISAGLNHCGDVESYLDALTVFAQSVTSGAKEIADFCKKSDWKNYTTKVHALKSSARVIGAEELSDRAKRLEDAGNSGYINEIKESTDGLLELYISFAEKLSPLLETDSDDSDKPTIEPEALAEAYETLREVAAGFDYDSMNFVLQSLDDYKLPPDDSEKISSVKSALNKLDWEKIKILVG